VHEKYNGISTIWKERKETTERKKEEKRIRIIIKKKKRRKKIKNIKEMKKK